MICVVSPRSVSRARSVSPSDGPMQMSPSTTLSLAKTSRSPSTDFTRSHGSSRVRRTRTLTLKSFRAASMRSRSLPTAPVAPVKRIDWRLISMLHDHAGPIRPVTEREQQQVIPLLDRSAFRRLAQVEQIVGRDRMPDPCDVLGVDPVGRAPDQPAEYLPAAQRNIVRNDESDVVHHQAGLRERSLDQRFGGGEIRGDDLVLDLLAVPESAFRNLGAFDDSVCLATSAYDRGAGSVRDKIVRQIAMTSRRKLVGADAQHCLQVVFRHDQRARQS